MRTVASLTFLLALGLAPSWAQQRSPGQAAIESAEACIKTKAAAYADLDDPISEIAEVALASCAGPIQRVRDAVESALPEDRSENAMRGFGSDFQKLAIVAVADARLAKSREK